MQVICGKLFEFSPSSHWISWTHFFLVTPYGAIDVIVNIGLGIGNKPLPKPVSVDQILLTPYGVTKGLWV